MVTIEKLTKEIELPQGVSFENKDRVIKIVGPKGSVSKKIATKAIEVKLSEGKVILSPKVKSSRSEKCLVNTNYAHIVNMIKGVQEPFSYKLRICSSHFPMTVKINGEYLEVSNFIGEKVIRKLKLKKGADVKVEGTLISVVSPDKELAGQIAAAIEKLTKRANFDKRIFMDGIYMIEKAGVELK